MGLFTILSQYYDRQKQNAMQLGSPELFFMMSQAALQAEDYLVRRLVDTFREANVDTEKLLLYPKMEELLNAEANELVGGDAGGTQSIGPAARMAKLLITSGNGNGPARTSAAQRGGQRNRVGNNSTS